MTTNIYETPSSDVAIEQMESNKLTVKQILFSFQGRIGRKEYWLTAIISMAVMFVIMALLGTPGTDENVILIVVAVLYIPFAWIGLAVQIKRWHDRDKSGWWILISCIPIIGPFWALIENGFLAGTAGKNRFGWPNA